MLKGLFMDDKASPLWLARRRIVVASLIFEGVLITTIIGWCMYKETTNPVLDNALANLLYIFGATCLGYTGLATWGDKNDARFGRRDYDRRGSETGP